ncbi:MAG: hypothetical protein Q8L78_01655 [Coxiellaceae bacterium]|nr:hypothetical protein [Coxiellaceae bacterium]
MRKTLRKNRTLLIFIAILLSLLITRTLFSDHATGFQTHNAVAAPYTKEEQEALAAEQEQQDERGENGPLTAKISAVEAQNNVLNLHK